MPATGRLSRNLGQLLHGCNMNVYLDYETYGELDLTQVGTYNYVNHPSTGVHVLGFAVPEVSSIVHQIKGNDFASRAAEQHLLSLSERPDAVFICHNVPFDYSVWHTTEAHPVPLNRWKCTMAKCYSYGLPGRLKDAAKALSLTNQKDMEGQKSMLFLAKPKPEGGFWTYAERPDDFETLYDYNRKDILAMIELDQEIPDLTETERQVWELDFRMNRRGIMFDIPLVKKVIEWAEIEKGDLFAQFNEIAGFNPSQDKVFKQWMKDTFSVDLKNVRKETLEKIYRDLSPEAQLAVDLRLQASKRSLAKYPTILRRSDICGVFRDLSQYHGAHTGRFAHRGVQLGNLARPVNSSGEEFSIMTIIRAIELCDYQTFGELYDNLSEALSFAIRGMIIARPYNMEI